MAGDTDADRQLWDKQPGETFKAHEAYRQYQDLGAERNLKAVAWKRNVSWTMIKRWSTTWGWVKRVEAYDAYMAKIAQDAKERTAKVLAEKWAARQIEAAERAWKEADKLSEWADEVMESVKKRGSIGTIIKVFQAAGITRERALILALQATLENDGFDPITASPDALRAYLAKHGVKAQGAIGPGQ